MTEPHRYVEPEITEARVERLWGRISDGLQSRRKPIWQWSVAGGLAVAAGLGLWLAQKPLASPRAELANGHVQASAEVVPLRLRDGSSLSLEPRSALRVQADRPDAVALALEHGRAAFDVAHVEGRKFKVTAGDVEVRVVGTQFQVTSTAGPAPRVEVSVSRGVVEVVSARQPGVVARVVAGQVWVQEAGRAANEQAPAPTPPTAPTAAGLSPSPSALPVEPEKAPPAAAGSVKASEAMPSARELFEKAGERRRAGDAAGAARAYEELLRIHPSDGRASLSAFELGRLRMDRLGDSAGAIQALERAVALGASSAFREDALARLVSVYAAQGNFAACGRARDRYLSSYPNGVHAGAVTSRCGGR